MNFNDKIEADIEKHGCTVIGVAGCGSTPSFAYTIGLTKAGYPELIMMGVPVQYAHLMIMDLIQKLKTEHGGKVPNPGDTFVIGQDKQGNDSSCGIDHVGTWALDEYLCQAKFWAEDRGLLLTARQMTVPDREGRLPGEPEYDAAYMDKFQPCLNEAKTWTVV